MKRRQCFAGILLLALLAGGASVWEGSAVVGGAGDFPGDGLFGACNSFPRDASVEVSNLENGKTITVVITRNVENPGVFIALSPKAASELGMRQGTAARVRAVALSLSMTESTLPAARAGETADPDFNPKIYVERDKAIAQSRIAQEQASKTSAPAAPAAPAAPTLASAPQAAAVAAPVAETAASIIAEASAAPAAVAPPVKTEAIAAEVPAPIEADKLEPEIEKTPADPYPLPELAAADHGAPRPESVGVSLPTPDPAPIPAAGEKPSPRVFPANVPEAIGGSFPHPRTAAAARAYLPEPQVPERVVDDESADASIAASDLQPSVEGGDRPLAPESERIAQLAEPELEFQPDELPEELLPRLAGPAPTVPDVALAEIDMSGLVIAASDENLEPETIAIERPAGAEAVAFEEELSDPTTPSPTESIAVERPEGMEGEVAQAELQEPEAASVATDEGPTAVAVETPDRETSPEAELGIPATPSPSESLAVERPNEGPYTGEEGGEIAVDLEPTAPRPPATAAPAEAPASTEAAIAESATAVAPSETAKVEQAAPSPNAIAVAKVPGKPAEQPPSVPLLASLSRGFFYVQIGVYGSNDSLLGAVDGFGSTYPLAVEKVSAKGGSYAYRLYVGPLTRDESGLVLFKIKSMGYRDAFVKQGT